MSEVAYLREDAIAAYVALRTVIGRLEGPRVDKIYIVSRGGLWRRAIHYYTGVAALLHLDFLDAATVLVRCAYETSVHLVYLITRSNKLENARLFYARSLLEAEQLHGPYSPAGRAAREELESLDRALVTRATDQTRLGPGTPWSGKLLGEMADEVGIKGHRRMYQQMSWTVHPSASDWREVAGIIEWRDEPRDVELLARHTRNWLRIVHTTVAKDLGYKGKAFSTPSPRQK